MLFAHMKQHFRFIRLKLRGLAGAAEEFLLVATISEPAPPDPAAAARYSATVRSSDVLKDQNLMESGGTQNLTDT